MKLFCRYYSSFIIVYGYGIKNYIQYIIEKDDIAKIKAWTARLRCMWNTGIQKKIKWNAINIEPIFNYVFGVAEFESEIRIGPSGPNFFVISKTCFLLLFFFKRYSAQRRAWSFFTHYFGVMGNQNMSKNLR